MWRWRSTISKPASACGTAGSIRTASRYKIATATRFYPRWNGAGGEARRLWHGLRGRPRWHGNHQPARRRAVVEGNRSFVIDEPGIATADFHYSRLFPG